jgi:dephospho-CoA kinase
MQLLGLVGGIASGKTLVADCFRQLGAAVLNADHAGHEVLRESEVIAALRTRWGDGILDGAGQIDRAAVAKIVFAPGGSDELRFLESISHPRIGLRLAQNLRELRGQPKPPKLAVLDAALLFEAGWDAICDGIIYVDAPREQRLARAVSRGWTEEQFTAREAAQFPLETKRARAEAIVNNVGTLEQAMEEVEAIWVKHVGEPGSLNPLAEPSSSPRPAGE